MNTKSIQVGTIELTIAMLLSGTIGYFVVHSEQAFWNVVFFRCVIGAITLGAYAFYKGLLKREYFRQQVLWLIILGGVILVTNWVMLFASFNYIPFSIATVAYHMQPLFLVFLGAWLTREHLSGQLFFWLGLAFLGLFLMVELDLETLKSLFTETENGHEAILGLALALGAALLYTATTLVSDVPPHVVALVQVIVGIFMLLPFADFQQLPTDNRRWMDLIILGVVHTGFMYIIMYGSFQKLPTSLIALLSFIYPVTALVVDYWAFSTTITALQGLGVMLILLAVCAVKFQWHLTFNFRSKNQS